MATPRPVIINISKKNKKKKEATTTITATKTRKKTSAVPKLKYPPTCISYSKYMYIYVAKSEDATS